MEITVKKLPIDRDLETVAVLKALSAASRALAELKGEVQLIPNEEILISTLGLQEAKDSSEIENIVTTQDDLYRSTVDDSFKNLAAKEVKSYATALREGFRLVRDSELLTANNIKEIQSVLEPAKSGFRKVPGTALKDSSGNTVYTPPQNGLEIIELMSNLEKYINDDSLQEIDPLIKMAVIHFQFESIHPFYDGNGRAGRIINILYLVLKGLLDIPVLYLSRYIIENKAAYYESLQAVRDNEEWEKWVVWMLIGVETTARDTIQIVKEIRAIMHRFKTKMREETSFYSKELLDTLFVHPYTKISFVEAALGVHRNTAASYLNELCSIGLLVKLKLGKSNYYLNTALFKLLSRDI